MGRPSDRSSGVRLITDYGALEWALAQKAKNEAKREENVKKLNAIYAQGS